MNASVTQRSAAFFDVAALVSEAFTSVIIADIVLFFLEIFYHIYSRCSIRKMMGKKRSGGVGE